MKHKVEKAKGQSNNLIFDITNETLNQEEIIKKTEALFSDKDAENLNIAIIIKDKNILKIFKRKK